MSQGVYRKPPSKVPLSVDILLEEISTNASNATLTTALIKFLCYQKGQIPVPFNQLENRLNQEDLQETLPTALGDGSLMVWLYLF